MRFGYDVLSPTNKFDNLKQSRVNAKKSNSLHLFLQNKIRFPKTRNGLLLTYLLKAIAY